jgi:hypothetical protein
LYKETCEGCSSLIKVDVEENKSNYYECFIENRIVSLLYEGIGAKPDWCPLDKGIIELNE